jgi:hypothetical protein
MKSAMPALRVFSDSRQCAAHFQVLILEFQVFLIYPRLQLHFILLSCRGTWLTRNYVKFN